MAGGRELIKELVDAKAVDMAKLSKLAGKNSAYIQQFISRGVPAELPESVREKLAPALGVHPDALRKESRSAGNYSQYGLQVRETADKSTPHVNLSLPDKGNVRFQGVASNLPLMSHGAHVPVFGAVEAGKDGALEINFDGAPIGWEPIPPKMVGIEGIFCVIVTGESMAPKFEPGETIYVQRGREPIARDYVVVVVDDGSPGKPPRSFLKRLVRKSADTFELEQHNPRGFITVNRSKVKEVYRVLTTKDMIG